jgi:plasmid stability protein
MTLTLPNLPKDLGDALKARAAAEGRSVEDVAVEALRASLEPLADGVKKCDLSHLAGTWVEDPEFDAIMEEQDRIDPELWR